MAMPRQTASAGPIVLSIVMTALVLAAAAWRVRLHALDEQIAQQRGALKRLTVSQGVFPTADVQAYLKERDAALRQSYQQWLARIVMEDKSAALGADPQLFFQERVHEVQHSLERLSAGRNVPVPEIIGLPKDLPPIETVPRLLAQLNLAQTAAALILEQGPVAISTLKLEDPEPINSSEGRGVLLTRVPLRVRMSSSLPHLTRLLEMLARSRPLIDVRSLRLVSAQTAGPPAATKAPAKPAAAESPKKSSSLEALEVEIVLARYLTSTPLGTLLQEQASSAENAAKETDGSIKSRQSKLKAAAEDGA